MSVCVHLYMHRLSGNFTINWHLRFEATRHKGKKRVEEKRRALLPFKCFSNHCSECLLTYLDLSENLGYVIFQICVNASSHKQKAACG